jgi:inositol-polyphosphate multikinase
MDGSIIVKPCTQAEIDFYQAAQSTKHRDLSAHMPAFMGVLALSQDQTVPANGVGPALQVHEKVPPELAAHVPKGWLPSHVAANVPAVSIDDPISSKRTSWKPSGGKKLDTPTAIVLENVAYKVRHPNILDIKLGSRLWADDAPEAKRRKLDEDSKNTTSGSLGFRIAGMKVWVGELSNEDQAKSEDKERGIEYEDGYLCYNKLYGRSFEARSVREAFVDYFGGMKYHEDGRSIFKRDSILHITARISEELENIRRVFKDEEVRMYSASILIVHEGDEEWLMSDLAKDVKKEDDEDSDDEEPAKLVDVRLIDFAHAAFVPGEGEDENVLRGVSSVIRVLSELQQVAKYGE